MNNKNFNVCFDLGSSKIRAAAFNISDIKNSFYLESFCNSNFNTKNSDYLNLESEIEKITLNLEKKTNEYLDSINLMIDTPEMFSVSLSLSKNFDNVKLKKEDVQFLIQDAKQQISKNYPDYNIMHIIIKNYKINNENFDFLSTEIDCNILSIDIIFICIPKKIIGDLKKIFSKFDVSIHQIFCSSYAKSLSYRENFKHNENVAFIDMGYNKTSINYYDKNNFIFFHTLPIGGNHITKDLSKILNIDLVIAEQIKLHFDTDKKILIEHNISLDLIRKIIFARIEEILELSIKSIGLNEDLVAINEFRLIVMGEGSKILDNKFKDKISFSKKIDLLEETNLGICESALRISEGTNKKEVVIIPKKQTNVRFFEKLFHFFN